MEKMLANYINKIDEIYAQKMLELSQDIQKNKKEYEDIKDEYYGLKDLYTNLFNFKGIPEQYVSIDIFLMMKNQVLLPVGGTYRNTNALISGSNVKCAKPEEIGKKIKELDVKFKELKTLSSNIDNVDKYIEEVLKLKVEVIKIHPFVDGNGRCARALADYLLMIAGLEINPYNKHDMDEHKRYINAMAKMAENNESNDLVDFYKQHITNLKEKRK